MSCRWFNFYLCALSNIELIAFFFSPQSYGTIDPLVIWMSILFGLLTLCLVFSVCEIGQHFTNSFAEIISEIKQWNWYLFPIEIQSILPMIMVNTQEPSTIGYNIIFTCSRHQFKQVWSFELTGNC